MIIGNQLLESLIWFREAYRTPRLPGVVHGDKDDDHKVVVVISCKSSCPVRGEHGVFLCVNKVYFCACVVLSFWCLLSDEWRAALWLAVKAVTIDKGAGSKQNEL
jgi:hypothetical protein